MYVSIYPFNSVGQLGTVPDTLESYFPYHFYKINHQVFSQPFHIAQIGTGMQNVITCSQPICIRTLGPLYTGANSPSAFGCGRKPTGRTSKFHAGSVLAKMQTTDPSSARHKCYLLYKKWKRVSEKAATLICGSH